jgi:hypothetical protein
MAEILVDLGKLKPHVVKTMQGTIPCWFGELIDKQHRVVYRTPKCLAQYQVHRDIRAWFEEMKKRPPDKRTVWIDD